MKHGELKSIAHNIADSLGSGIGLLIGYYEMDVYGEAAKSPAGHITVNFLTGQITGGPASAGLKDAVDAYCQALPELCARHGASPTDFDELIVRFSATPLASRFLVTVRDARGQLSETEYGGIPAQRVKISDGHGRLRPKVR